MARIAIGTVLALMLAAAASYAAAGHGGRGKERHDPTAPATTPGEPVTTDGSGVLRIVGHPAAVTTRSTARFRVTAAGNPTLRCRLDRRPAQACEETAVLYRGVGVGPHTFSVAAVRRGRTLARASYDWLVLEPKPFTVSPRPTAVGPLYPGAAPSSIPVTISNPNPVPITVTSLQVTAGGGAPGCSPADNVALTAPALAGGKLRIAAHASVSLPSAAVAAPTIALRELPVDQDACKNAAFDLAFSGSAGG
ncbi:MAG TPA: hypothetical protein VMF55_01050 [Solirubrobacterales bacterium]|nr:hypothetical protein [Solirubrobacterales bacterium]